LLIGGSPFQGRCPASEVNDGGCPKKPDHLNHPNTAASLNNLAFLYFSQGAYAKAEPLLRRGIGSQSLFLQSQLPLLPQAARLAQVQTLDNSWEFAFSGAERSSSAAELALFSRLNRYGLLLEIEQRQAQLARAPGAPQARARDIADLTTRLADVAIPAAQRQKLGKLREELEREFYRLLPSLKPQLVEPAQVARLLPAGAVLVEFQRYKPFDGRQKEGQRWGAPRYLALVLNPAGSTRAVDLGPAAAIDPLIARALKGSEASSGDPSTLWQQVNEKVFPAPLLQLLAGANQWILAPDGELSRIPYVALPSPRDPQRRLPDTVTLKLLSSGRSLLPQSPAPGSAFTRPLVLADPDFGPPPANGSGWKPLPASAKEGQAISKLLRAALYEKADATTSVLTNAQNPSLVHVASHGYYASASESPPPTPAPPPAGGLRSAIAGLPASREDAMLNSGIVLAGANRNLRPDRTPAAIPSASQGNADDGYLTAKEAAQLKLRGTELVVLSACDTASGDQQSGEGLFGLQRALSVAGARSTLLSLWKVDDNATAYFMERYYTLLKQGKGRMEALLAVQEEFRTKPLCPATIR
jgi:CHAT domain-containing protein